MGKTKILCEGTDSVPAETRTVFNETWGKCRFCQRVLKPKSSGRLRQHQVRGRTTVTGDRLNESLWASAGER